MKFRKLPIVIDAVQWTGENRQAVLDFLGAKGGFWSDDQRIHVFTPEGTMTGYVGDWITRGAKGELYPIKEPIFLETYEAVDDAD